jgi:hypothetical protein
MALGSIGTPEAARVLHKASPDDSLQAVCAQACLLCADRLLDAGQTAPARSLYEHVRSNAPDDLLREAGRQGLERMEG